MCGIVGIYHADTSRPISESALRRMADAIRHRGPDAEGYRIEGRIGFGFRRLSIIDLSTAGNQPLSNEDGTVWTIFNGEIYNYREQRAELQAKGHVFRTSTDTETIVHLYEEYGIGCIAHLRGMFACAIWDSPRQRLYLIRDRLGIKPVFYYQEAGRLLFASEAKAILADSTVPRSVDRQSLHDYLHFMSVPHPRTMFEGILRLPPGHYLSAGSDGVSVHQYWEVPWDRGEVRPDQYYIDELDHRLEDSVASHLVSDVPLGAFLSGGLDSSAVAAMMRRSQDDVRTFSISFPGDPLDESRYARQVSQHLGTVHREFSVTPDLIGSLPKIVWHLDQPFAVPSAFATYHLSMLTRSAVTVALSGDGGDELFAGYTYRLHIDQTLRKYAWLPLAARRFLNEIIQSVPVIGSAESRDRFINFQRFLGYLAHPSDDAYLQTLTMFDEREKRELYERSLEPLLTLVPSSRVMTDRYAGHPWPSTLQKRLAVDMATNLVDEMLTKVDAMSMAASLEVRVPFLDHRLVEWAMQIPDHLKLSGREGKLILKRTLEKHLPREAVYRPKQGFAVPVDRWFRGELSGYLKDILSDSALARHGFFDPRSVRRLIDRHERHQGNYGVHLYALLMFQLWHDTFFPHGRG